MNRVKIEHGTIGYLAIFNLSGIFHDKPIRVMYKANDMDARRSGYWVAMGKNTFDICEEVGLGMTRLDRRVIFVSIDKKETELFLASIDAVVDIARNSLFYKE
jgi:hypothetical protein